MDSIRVFLMSLRQLRKRRDGSPVVLIATGVWLPVLAYMLSSLNERTVAHLDVPGIPHQEVAISKPRLWRAKVVIYRLAFGWAVRHAAVLSTINRTHARFIQEKYGKTPLVIPDLLKEQWLAALLRVSPSRPNGKVTILWAGSLFARRIDLFLKVVKELTSTGGVRVTVVGDGASQASYREEYGCEDIEFTGYVPQKRFLEIISAADICYSDVWHKIGTPYKVLEYMAAGRAVVTHDTASMRESIEPGVDGLLCQESDACLKTTLESLVLDRNLREAIGMAARERIRQLHQGDRLRGLVSVYKQVSDAYGLDSSEGTAQHPVA
jgi:glycosyltransferase involved in cell wall biosynthesis